MVSHDGSRDACSGQWLPRGHRGNPTRGDQATLGRTFKSIASRKSASVTGWSWAISALVPRRQFEERYLSAVHANAAFGPEPDQPFAA